MTFNPFLDHGLGPSNSMANPKTLKANRVMLEVSCWPTVIVEAGNQHNHSLVKDCTCFIFSPTVDTKKLKEVKLNQSKLAACGTYRRHFSAEQNMSTTYA